MEYRTLIKKPWVFIRVLNMNPDILVVGPGVLNQVPTVGRCGLYGFRFLDLGLRGSN